MIAVAADPTSRVHMDVQPGERVVFGETGVAVEFVAKSGRAARVVVTMPRDVTITRDGVRTKHAKLGVTERG
jgi:hypothetical protein